MARSKRRQLVVMGPRTKGGNAPLGRLRELRETFARFNTSGDGGPQPASGLETLHGPGMVVELPTSMDPVNQAIATLNDDDIAWPVLMKLCKDLGWQLMDIESGRTFG